MVKKWINPAIGLIAGFLTYLLVSGDQLGPVGIVAFAGPFVVVWSGLNSLSSKESSRDGGAPEAAA